MELKKIHEDERRAIYLVKNLLPNNKEFTFINLKKGKAIGGCYHSDDEHFAIIKGKVKIILGNKEWIAKEGEAGIFPAKVPHAFIALEDSTVSEWGITTEEKESDVKDPEMRKKIDMINKNVSNFKIED